MALKVGRRNPKKRALAESQVWRALLGHGALRRDEAVRIASETLGASSLSDIEGAIDVGLADGTFDSPEPSRVRALIGRPGRMEHDHWLQLIQEALSLMPCPVV